MKNYRKDFPIFKNFASVKKPFVYFDSAATSQKPQVVIDAITEFYEKKNANINRAAYQLAEQATIDFEQTRLEVAKFINAHDGHSIIFTKGATEGINLVAHAWARHNLKHGDVILLTEMEHHANIVPWQEIAKEKGLVLRYWPITKSGELEKVSDRLFANVKLLAITHVSNVLGTINPIAKITAYAHRRNIVVLIDAAQSASCMLIDVEKIKPDFLIFSAHKMYGPTGVGVLYVAPQRVMEMQPYQTGGDMIERVDWQRVKFKKAPWKFEAGTQPLAEVYSLRRAMNYLQKIGKHALIDHQKELTDYAYQQLKKIPEITLYGPNANKRIGLIAFSVYSIHAHDLATWLDGYGIAVRAGHHCAQPLHERLGVPATTRISFGVYNTKKEIDYFITTLKKIILEWQRSTKK